MKTRMTRGNLFLAESLIEDIMAYFQAVGLIAAVVDREGNYLYKKSWGYADGEKKTKINEDTIFGIASITKSFTALSIMQLEERGILSVKDRVADYLEEYRGSQAEGVRIEHFLSHSPGYFPLARILVKEVGDRLGLEGELARSLPLAEEGGRLVAKRLSELGEEGILGQPGQYFSYCNDGYGLLSEIIRIHGGEKSFADYLEKNILGPLGMTRSFCDFLKGARDDNAASLYKIEEGKLLESRDYHDNAFVLNGGGALKSTLRDLKSYLGVYLSEGNGVISWPSVEAMIEKRMDYLERDGYGYGLYTRDHEGYRVTGHGGSLSGVSSNLAWSQELGVGIIILSNTSGVPVSRISDALFRVVAGKSPLDTRDYRQKSWDKDTISKVLGNYSSGEGTNLKLFMDKDLEIEVDGERKLLVPISENSALVREKFIDTYLEIRWKKNGEVLGLSLGSRIIPKVEE